ncbi:MAG: MATE family efflux transporter [Enterocloster citroniae]|nr:MATE family efflux transporter [Enterocloster citroniae]
MAELCVQATFSVMLYNIYIVTDTLFVSKGVGSTASGAIGVFSPVLVFVGGISSTLGVGAGSIISRRLGEKDLTGGKTVIGCMVWVWCLCALAITVIGLIFFNTLLGVLGCTAEIYPYAVEYGRIMLLGTICSTGFSGVMRAGGDTLYSTLQWCCPVLINMALDPVLIYGFRMGITGAALATVCAQVFSLLCSIYYFFIRNATPCKIRIRDIRWDFGAFKEILSIGMPSFLNSLGNSFVGMAGNQILGTVYGTHAISTFTVISRIQAFVTTPFTGIMQGIQPMLGFDWGRKNTDRVRRTVFFALRFVLIYGSLVSMGLYAGASYIIRFFSSDADVMWAGTLALKIICWATCAGGVMPVIQAFFQALGQGKRVLRLSMICIFLIRLPFLLLGGIVKNISIMWWVFVISDWIAAAMAVFSYKKFQKERSDGKLNKEQAE